MKLAAGIDSLGLPDLFGNAAKRIIMHAAIYGPFAESAPHWDGLIQALNRTSFKRLDIIALSETCPQPWQDQFLDVLRNGTSENEKTEAIQSSEKFLEKLHATAPTKVFIHPLTTLPCQPVIIVDDTIIFGQYAHCGTYAAQGFWGCIETDVDKLFLWSENDNVPADSTAEEIAAYRIVAECRHAMRHKETACTS